MWRASLIAMIVLTLPFSTSSGVVIRVPSEAPSIQAAVNWSSSGDTLLVEPGTYSGSMNSDIDFSGKSVTLCSEGGADVTTIDGEGVNRAFVMIGGEHVVIEGFTVQNGYKYFSGAIYIDDGATTVVRSCRFVDCGGVEAGVVRCTDGSSAAFEDCLFQDNAASDEGGVAYIRGASLTFDRCEFVRNSAPTGGVFRSIGGTGGHTTVNDCWFIENSAHAGSVFYTERWTTRFYADGCVFSENSATYGLLQLDGGSFELSDCLFERNTSEQGWLVSAGSGLTSIMNTTFVENSSTYGIIDVAPITVSNVVVAFSTLGPAVYDGAPILSCCDIYGNAGGDWVGPIASQLGIDGNICEDPLFCGASNPESPYSLHENSPCAASNSGGCGTIGRWDEGCGISATESSTWGSIKARYR